MKIEVIGDNPIDPKSEIAEALSRVANEDNYQGFCAALNLYVANGCTQRISAAIDSALQLSNDVHQLGTNTPIVLNNTGKDENLEGLLGDISAELGTHLETCGLQC